MENAGSRQLIAFLLILVIIILTPKYMEWASPLPSENDQVFDQEFPEESMPSISNTSEQTNSLQVFTKKDSVHKHTDEIKFTVETPLYIVTISNLGGGSLSEILLKEFNGGYSDGGEYLEDNLVSMLMPENDGCTPCMVSRDEETGERVFRKDAFFTDAQDGESFILENGESKEFNFWMDYKDGTSIKNTLVVSSDVYFLDYNYEINHPQVEPFAPEIAWTSGLRPTEKNEGEDVTESGVILWQAGESEDLNISSNEIHDLEILDGRTDWVAIKSKYFIASIIPDIAGIYGGFSGRNFNFGSRNITPFYTGHIGFSKRLNQLSGKIFVGPQDIEHLRQTGSNLEDAMNWGYFIIRPISKFILNLLTFFHKPVNGVVINYGLVLILFAVLIRILTGPLTKKAALSNQKIQKLQPELKKIQTKFKDDPMRLQQETMKIWRENKVNPMGGCLPILVQMPLLFALFVTFRSTIEFRGAPFALWINDLSQPDTIFHLPFSIPIYGSHVAVLPLIMGFSMFFQQKMTSANIDKNHKPMMYMMTGFFFLIFNSFPSGLNLYYAASNFLNIIQQRNIKKAFEQTHQKA